MFSCYMWVMYPTIEYRPSTKRMPQHPMINSTSFLFMTDLLEVIDYEANHCGCGHCPTEDDSDYIFYGYSCSHGHIS